MTRRGKNTNRFAENRSYTAAYEEGFERGQRAAIAADRFFWAVIGFLAGTVAILIIRAL